MKCLRCLKPIALDDTITFEADEVVHLDCRRPRTLSPHERALLFLYCWAHAVAKCAACAREFHLQELGADFLGDRTHLCPGCRADLIEGVRDHLSNCAMLPAELRQRARAALREAMQRTQRPP